MPAAGEGDAGDSEESESSEDEEERDPGALGLSADLSAKGAPAGAAGAAAGAAAEVQPQQAVETDGTNDEGDDIEEEGVGLEPSEPVKGNCQAAPGGAALEEGAEQAAGEAGPSQAAVRKSKRYLRLEFIHI